MTVKTSIRFDNDFPIAEGDRVDSTVVYRDSTGLFRAGFWTAGPDSKPLDLVDHVSEFCTILEGVVHLTDAKGHTEVYRKGDSFFIPAGFSGKWEAVEPVRKFFVTHNEKQKR